MAKNRQVQVNVDTISVGIIFWNLIILLRRLPVIKTFICLLTMTYVFQKLYYVKEAHSIFVTGLAFMPSSQAALAVTGNQDFTLMSISVDNTIRVHQVAPRSKFCILMSSQGLPNLHVNFDSTRDGVLKVLAWEASGLEFEPRTCLCDFRGWASPASK